MLLSVSLVVEATGTSYYYKLSAKTNATGRGLVYATTYSEHGPWFAQEIIKNGAVSSKLNSAESASQSTKIYLYAKPNEGYALEKWTDSIGNTVTHGSNYTLIAPSTDITKPTANIFTAHFVDTYVSVFSANDDLCAVSINPAINSAGQTVKLTATPKTGATFLGWRIKGTATILSTQQSNYEVTATSTKTTYEAVFRYVGTQQSFVRMQSQSETDKYMSIAQDKFSYTTVLQAAHGYSGLAGQNGYNADTCKKEALTTASGFLSEDLSLSDNVYDPGQVIWHDATNKNFYAQGTDVGYITDGFSCHHGGSTLVGVSGIKLKIDAQDINYDSYSRLTMNPSVNYDGMTYNLGNIYITNDNGAIGVTQTAGTSSGYKWEKQSIDGTNQYFAFYPDLLDSRTGKYYTTLRTSFSYKIKNPDKVTAYEINEIADGKAVLTPFENGEIIPGDLAVVLESTSQEPTDNILLPYDLEYTKANTVLYGKYGHRLHCFNGSANSGDQYDGCTEGGIGYFKVTYNSTNMGDMYKLDVNDAGEVGFWTKVTSGTVSGNEAYSTVPCALFEIEEQGTPLADILASGENGVEYTVSDDLAVVDYADVANYAFLTDGNGNWIKVAANDEVFAQIINKQVIKGNSLKATLSDIELNPVLTATVAPTEGDATVDYTIDQYYLNDTFAPKVNQVIDVMGWWNESEGTLRAYSPDNGVQGQSLTLDYTWGATSNTLQNGKRYNVRCAINIKEAWHTNVSGIAPKDYNYDFQNYIGYALRMPDAPTAIGLVDAEPANDVVNVYNMQGVLLKRGVNASEATSGLGRGVYIVGNKKVIVK